MIFITKVNDNHIVCPQMASSHGVALLWQYTSSYIGTQVRASTILGGPAQARQAFVGALLVCVSHLYGYAWSVRVKGEGLHLKSHLLVFVR